MISHNAYIVLLVVFQLVGLATYLQGFFPVKKALQGRADHADLAPEPGLDERGKPLQEKFDRLVIVLVDALRADFVFSGGQRMPYTERLIKNNETVSMLAKAHPPTVTMPRIKAMTSGSIPGFIDVMLNAHSKAFLEDNLVTQMRHAQKRLVFYGDDTWLKLFPDHFFRSDGTTSFFVTDYTEVDNNVTRHIDSELEKEDWDVLILHFLGLDHIGHTAGPSSPLVGPKLLEMDQVVQQIHKAILRWDQDRERPSLLLLCGDHGMSDAGSHGGASPAEVFTPLVFMSSLFEQQQGSAVSEQQVQQIDIVPTLALLLGLPIPQNSIGTIILQTFKYHTPREKLRALQLNAVQLSKVLQANDHPTEDIWELNQALKLHSGWITAAGDGTQTQESSRAWADKIATLYATALRKMSARVAASISNYDLHALAVGIAVLLQTFAWSVWGLTCGATALTSSISSILRSATGVFVTGAAASVAVMIHLSVCSGTHTGASEILCSVNPQAVVVSTAFCAVTAVSLATAVLSVFQEDSFLRKKLLSSWRALFGAKSSTAKLLITGTLLHTVSLLSSSFVEEEHQTWYYLTTAYFLIIPCYIFEGQKSDDASTKTTIVQGARNDRTEVKFEEKSVRQRGLQERHQPTGPTVSRENKDFDIASEKFEGGAVQAHEPDTREATLREKAAPKVNTREIVISWAASSILLVLGRISRTWNQTGIKWADRADTGDWLLQPDNQKLLSLTVVISIVIIWLLRRGRHNPFSSLMFLVGGIGVHGYRSVTGALWSPWEVASGKGISEARFVLACVAAVLLWSSVCFCIAYAWETTSSRPAPVRRYHFDFMENILSALLLLSVLLLRPHNIALLAVFVVQEHILSRYVWSRQIEEPWLVALSGLWMGQAAYFAQGNSNSLASVDLAAGYIGLTEHDPGLVLGLLCMATYCGPILWFTSVVLFFIRHSFSIERLAFSLNQLCHVRVVCQALLLSVYTVLVSVQRYHLFVWSVFSPKLLYELMATIVLSVCIACAVGLVWLMSRKCRPAQAKRHCEGMRHARPTE